jgi:alpha-D-ribose 1-methylphosphonate 5-triphosphate diphosphatase
MILTNARIVTAGDEFDGTVVVHHGRIAAVDRGHSHAPTAIDLDGDWLLPGFVELHTDNLEKHYAPRPGVRWPARSAVIAHDAQIAAAGITTVFDAVAVGDVFVKGDRVAGLRDMFEAIAAAQQADLLRAEHHVHLRCEISYPGTLERFEALVDAPLVGLLSVMDHTPGQRQFADTSKLKFYYQHKHGMSDAEFDDFARQRRDDRMRHGDRCRDAVIAAARARKLPLASHDDATTDQVAESAGFGMTIAEFPTTREAAAACRAHDMAVLVGGPNIVLGGSHSGNVSALDLAAEGLVDIVSSDYVPASLIEAVGRLARRTGMPAAVRTVSLHPARAVGLADRGDIAPGLRADLLRVRRGEEPIVRTVWRAGARVV